MTPLRYRCVCFDEAVRRRVPGCPNDVAAYNGSGECLAIPNSAASHSHRPDRMIGLGNPEALSAAWAGAYSYPVAARIISANKRHEARA
jgi:hypothetical protein